MAVHPHTPPLAVASLTTRQAPPPLHLRPHRPSQEGYLDLPGEGSSVERPLPPLHSRAVPSLPQASALHHQCAATSWSFQRQDSLVRHQLPPRLRGYFPPRCASDSVELQVKGRTT